MRRWLSAVACGGALGLVDVAGPAGAAELSVEPPLPCSSADEIAFLAERTLGRPLAQVPGPRLVIRMAAQGAGFGARLETQVDGVAVGVRAFSAATCAELIETVALGVAIALGAGDDAAEVDAVSAAAMPATAESTGARADQAREGAAGGAPDANGAGSEPLGRDDASATEPVPSTDGDGPVLAASAFFVGDSGSLPNPALGVAIGAGLRWSGLELRGAGLLLPARHGDVNGGVNGDAGGLANGEAGADIGLLAGWASACAPLRLEAEAVELGVCAGWEIGHLRATGTGVARAYRKSRLWTAPRLDVAARWNFSGSPLSLELLATGLVPLLRDEFILKDIGSVHRTPNVIARAHVGLGWALW